MQLLSDYLAGIAVLSDTMARHQQQADDLVKLFNVPVASVEFFEAEYPGSSQRYFFQGDIERESIVKNCVQRLAEYHMTEVRKCEAALEDLVKGRYLENSH